MVWSQTYIYLQVHIKQPEPEPQWVTAYGHSLTRNTGFLLCDDGMNIHTNTHTCGTNVSYMQK